MSSKPRSSAERPEGAGTTAPVAADPGGFRTARDASNLRRFNFWMLAAAVAYIAATAALRWREAIPAASPALQWLLVGATLLLALAAIRRYLLFLRQADELLRRIQLEALGTGFAVGAAVAMVYPLFELLGAPALGGRAIAVVLLLAWAVGSWFASRRYTGDA